jgi:hypothetical protein
MVGRLCTLGAATTCNAIEPASDALKARRLSAEVFDQAAPHRRPSHRLARQLLHGGVDGPNLHRLADSHQDLRDRRRDPPPPICGLGHGGRDRRWCCGSSAAKAFQGFGSTCSAHRIEQAIDDPLDPRDFDLCRRGRALRDRRPACSREGVIACPALQERFGVLRVQRPREQEPLAAVALFAL